MAATNRSKELKAERAGKTTKTMSTGVGESKVFGGGGEERDLSGYTCQGDPIPREMWPNFPFSMTDQGKAAAEKLKKELPVNYSKRARPAQTIYDQAPDDDKKQAVFREALQLDTEGLVISVDPMRPLIDRYTPKGHRGMFMSRRVSAEKGMVRGVLNYEPVLIEDGKGGLKEVTCGNMFLASVPNDLVRKSDAYWANVNRQKQITVTNKLREHTDKFIDPSDVKALLRSKGAGDADIGMEVEDRENADQDLLKHIPIDPDNDNDPVVVT